jgi:hypothetical protein
MTINLPVFERNQLFFRLLDLTRKNQEYQRFYTSSIDLMYLFYDRPQHISGKMYDHIARLWDILESPGK